MNNHRLLRQSSFVSFMLGLFSLNLVAFASESNQQKQHNQNSVVVTSSKHTAMQTAFEGQVEAVRQSNISAQVSGMVTRLTVKVGDKVAKGQVLAQLDSRSAVEAMNASQAQVEALKANLNLAKNDYERKLKLYQKNYISKAGLEQALATYKAVQAQTQAQLAGVAGTQTNLSYFTIRAPYSGVISKVNVEEGDMAMPAMPMLTIYDPSRLRVTANIPATVLAKNSISTQNTVLEITGRPYESPMVKPTNIQILPTINPQTLTQTIRADIPSGAVGVVAGMFARVWIPTEQAITSSTGLNSVSHTGNQSVFIPLKSVIRRGEMVGVYVVGQNGKPSLRQVRLGRTQGEQVQILSGVSVGEKVLLNPQTAMSLMK